MANRSTLLATAIGAAAIAMWGLLASLAAFAAKVPPFQLVALTMAIGALVGLVSWPFRPGAAAALRVPWRVWALGIYGLFGYHFFYFTALRLAPPVEANLICYLWPLLIVLLSAALPGERLRAHHVLGAMIGLAGTALIVTRGQGFDIRVAYVPGYLAALGCAFIWSSYSVLSRRFGAVPTDTVVGFCLASAGLAALCHLATETAAWPDGWQGWAAIALLGLLPTGLAFYVWDIGMKRGDIQVLGALSYATPVLSTLLLIAFGFGAASPVLFLALALVTAGALIASRDLLRRAAA